MRTIGDAIRDTWEDAAKLVEKITIEEAEKSAEAGVVGMYSNDYPEDVKALGERLCAALRARKR